jgi:hypothetical protein
MAKAPTEAAVKVVAINIVISFCMNKLLAMGSKETVLINVFAEAVEWVPSRDSIQHAAAAVYCKSTAAHGEPVLLADARTAEP